jgi:hypothetical protein
MNYRNAAEILPEELVNEIRKYYPCGMLWIPRSGLDHKERARLVVQLVEQNVPVKEVAELAEISPRHVRWLVDRHGGKRRDEDKN